MMANALLLHCMYPNFLLIAKKKKTENFKLLSCPFIRCIFAFQACPHQRNVRTGHLYRRFIITPIVISLLLVKRTLVAVVHMTQAKEE